MILNYHINDPLNLGDQACAPFRYFEGFEQRDIRDWTTTETAPQIFGGGGILHDGLIDILHAASKETNLRVIWGAGTNIHNLRAPIHPTWLSGFMVGVRDWGTPFNYVPCVSCMRPEFEPGAPQVTPQFRVVVYEHFERPIPVEPGAPRMRNNVGIDQFENVLRFLSLGETVVTNSFHGAYWAQLLGRKVLIFRPWSNRFYGFKYQPIICNENDYHEALPLIATRAPEGFAAECRQINVEFHKKVMERIQ